MDATEAYTFSPAFQVPEEIQRLDNLHKALFDYFGSRLSLAPLEDLKPVRILEVGSGSGAWAIQAAVAFPEAEVIATDKSPLPERPLPSNLHFVQNDLTEQIPFEHGTFDIVHARFVFMHLPNGEDILKRTLELVKPGGWFIIEEPNDDACRDGNEPLPPGFRAFVETWLSIIRSRGAEPCIGRDLGRILDESRLFSEVNIRKLVIPYSGQSKVEAEKRLGDAWRSIAIRNGEDFPKRFEKEGITTEVAQAMKAELLDSRRRLCTDVYFAWSRRKTY